VGTKEKAIAVIIKKTPCHQESQMEKLIIDEDQNANNIEMPAILINSCDLDILSQINNKNISTAIKHKSPITPTSRNSSKNQLWG
tara:strand:- start:35 stop:289 length:255 start_codon:yes stop_codon:yes gene_type:complete